MWVKAKPPFLSGGTNLLGLAMVAFMMLLRSPTWGSVSAGGGAGGMNPEGTYCVGDWISVQEQASAWSIVDLWGNEGSGHTQRLAGYTDPLLGAGLNQGNGWGNVAEAGHAYMLLEGMVGVFGFKQLEEGDIGEYVGNRFGLGTADASDGNNQQTAGGQDGAEYRYEVRRCWMMPPGAEAEPPEVLSEDEVSQ